MDKNLYDQIKALAKKHKDYPNQYDPSDPGNREKLIEKNLKLAVNTALKYRNLGLSEDELISASFLGLCVAYEKYNPQKAVAREALLYEITDKTTPDEFLVLVQEVMKYGDAVGKMFANGVPETPYEMRRWVTKNVKPAKFSSVAQFWIRAYILAELDKYSNVVRVPENARESNQFDLIDDDPAQFSNKIVQPDDDTDELESAWRKLFRGVPDVPRRIVELRYGIGCDKAYTLKEIADIYAHEVKWVKEVLSDTVQLCRDNAERCGIRMADLLS